MQKRWLSRPKFLHKEKTVCKMVRGEKIGKPSKTVEMIYVKRTGCGYVGSLVENLCGKPCGECGKLLVINRYSGSFQTKHPVENLGTLVCIIPEKTGQREITLPPPGRKFQGKRKEKVYNLVVFAVKKRERPWVAPKILLDLYKAHDGIIFQALEILVVP